MFFFLFVFISIFNFTFPLNALPIDPTTTTFSERAKRIVDHYDFSAVYPELHNIDIDAKRKPRVEMQLTGSFPVLETVNYEGGIGVFSANLTGSFPLLRQVNFSFATAEVVMDLRGSWSKECSLVIYNKKGDVTLLLPEGIGIEVITKTEPLQKVVLENPHLKKKGWGVLEKTYLNPLAREGKTLLHIYIQKQTGTIVLK